MSVKIKIGYIANDIVALCGDKEADYAFYAKKLPNGTYKARMSSSHGIITSGVFKTGVGTREMVLYSMAKHLESVTEAAEMEQKEKSHDSLAFNRALN